MKKAADQHLNRARAKVARRFTRYVSRLPNTTVWGVFATAEDANQAFDKALDAAGTAVGYKVTPERRCVTAMGDSSVKSDRRKKPESKWSGRTNFETSRLHQVNDPFFR